MISKTIDCSKNCVQHERRNSNSRLRQSLSSSLSTKLMVCIFLIITIIVITTTNVVHGFHQSQQLVYHQTINMRRRSCSSYNFYHCTSSTIKIRSSTTAIEMTNANTESESKKDNSTPPPIIYKDDCFGFITFIAGITFQDDIFTGIFVLLTLIAAILSKFNILPSDTKRPEIVDRKIPGIIAILTLLLSFGYYNNGINENNFIIGDYNFELSQKVQLGFCSFSIITSFLDIRWRDRFDYPNEFK